MSLLTFSQQSIPDYEHEYHTIIVDTINQPSKNTFSVYLQNPIENIVQARLTAAHVHTKSSNVCHISIDELNTNFNQQTTSQLNSPSFNFSFGTILTDVSGNFNFADNYPVVQQYITPVRKLGRMSFTLRNQNGDTIPKPDEDAENYFIFRFVCKKNNLPER